MVIVSEVDLILACMDPTPVTHSKFKGIFGVAVHLFVHIRLF